MVINTHHHVIACALHMGVDFKMASDFKEKELFEKAEKVLNESPSDLLKETVHTFSISDCAISLMSVKYKVHNDPIHGSIELHPLLSKIINTPAFDRLKYLKQLGGVYYVYAGAIHTRFEHSIGVCYIAGEFARMLQRKQPELGITKKEILGIEIAGLCHDMGHGPFSHMFDKDVLTKFNPKLKKKWRHEEMSRNVLDHIYWNAHSNLKKDFNYYGLNDEDLEFIKELIDHDLNNLKQRRKRRFLYEIVANKDTGIDVDKWDYFVRDCHYMGILNEFDWRRLMTLSRVVRVDDVFRICYRDKEVHNIYGMFRTRSSLHQRAYQHKVVIAVEHMLSSAIAIVKDVKIIYIRSLGRLISLAEAVDAALQDKPELDGFLALNDGIIHIIQAANPIVYGEEQEAIEKSQEILQRIARRELFHIVHLEKDQIGFGVTVDDITEAQEETGSFKKDDLYLRDVKISYGSEKKGNVDPVEDVYFYNKDDPTVPIKGDKLDKSELVIPKAFAEEEKRLYSGLGKDKDKIILKAVEMVAQTATPDTKSSNGMGPTAESTAKRRLDFPDAD